MVVATDVGEVRVTISIGIALLSPTLNEWSRLLKAADQSLYEAKRAGRNRTVINQSGQLLRA
jgi:two-component system cell cycle response regulator